MDRKSLQYILCSIQKSDDCKSGAKMIFPQSLSTILLFCSTKLV